MVFFFNAQNIQMNKSWWYFKNVSHLNQMALEQPTHQRQKECNSGGGAGAHL